MASARATTPQSTHPAPTTETGNPDRKLIRGPLQPSAHNSRPSSYTQSPRPINEIMFDRQRPGPEAAVMEICSTTLPQPFVNPDAPLTHGSTATPSPAQ
ncbi:hypothetical protein CMQ_485 [Grosmannia clavigera kw1407]|uniref:Uncharacterized protein n=1 Tax=Grosmannia clavigera (strain kw1407 / UAMH 11150) TaxID=655863 RepID=F0XDI0_GROCL|nr:uncharacterized protein CMQ_485 [Grosmannia clavigera kw1407]EFX03557.1 hypothetical protein CMQ_485 [Grosmannia clavigera kw1407]